MPEKIQKSMEEWKTQLTPEQFHVMFEKGTERAFTGALVNNHEDGIYRCGACNAPLFTSDTKFDSGSGWPSFWTPISVDAVEAHEDRAYGMKRVEITCANATASTPPPWPSKRNKSPQLWALIASVSCDPGSPANVLCLLGWGEWVSPNPFQARKNSIPHSSHRSLTR